MLPSMVLVFVACTQFGDSGKQNVWGPDFLMLFWKNPRTDFSFRRVDDAGAPKASKISFPMKPDDMLGCLGLRR